MFIFLADDAKMGLTETRLAIIPGAGKLNSLCACTGGYPSVCSGPAFFFKPQFKVCRFLRGGKKRGEAIFSKM